MQIDVLPGITVKLGIHLEAPTWKQSCPGLQIYLSSDAACLVLYGQT